MATTIQVNETTKQMLDNLKFKKKARSYDELIRSILEEKIAMPNMFGFTSKKSLKFRKEDEMSFNEL
jgi:hypothetical protein